MQLVTQSENTMSQPHDIQQAGTVYFGMKKTVSYTVVSLLAPTFVCCIANVEIKSLSCAAGVAISK